ncbi:autotransporter domain-containing protein [Candidatus Methylopumilus universalis]|uniref:autotransporter domain-containing protein n=1 Tax=Candidatus Methylopumilus universalis TaxID=2588536 RepID=UPI003BEED11B
MKRKIIPALILSLYLSSEVSADNTVRYYELGSGTAASLGLSGGIAITNRLDASGNDIPLTIYYDTSFPNPTQNFINLVNTARVDSIDFYRWPDENNQVFRSITGFIQNGESTYFDISGNYFDASGNLMSGSGIISSIELQNLSALSGGIKNYGFISSISGGLNPSTLDITNYSSGTIHRIDINGGGAFVGSILNEGSIAYDPQSAIYIAGSTLDGSITNTNTGIIQRLLNHGSGVITDSIINSGSIHLLENTQGSQINGSIINQTSGVITTLDLTGDPSGPVQAALSGDIVNSGTITTLYAGSLLPISGVQGSIKNSGTIDTLHLADKTLYLTGNGVINNLSATGANFNIGFNSSNTRAYTASNLDLFTLYDGSPSPSSPNTFSSFTIQQNSSLNLAYDPSGNNVNNLNVSNLDAMTFTNNGTLSLGSGVELNICANSNCGIDGAYTFSQGALGKIEFEINGSQAPSVYIDGDVYAAAGAKIAIKSGSVIDPTFLRFGVMQITGEYFGTFPTATTSSFSSNGSLYRYYLERTAENPQYLDLVFALLTGPSAADTQSSLNTQAHRLRSTFNSTMASGNFANMNTYDCNLFDKNNMCISAGGRYTNIDNPSSNHSAAVVTLGYKVSPNIRIGGFLDQSINNNTPTGIQVSNKNPMMGAFAVWNKNADGLGYQVKIANAYQDKDVRSTRDAFGETGEAGTGKTNLNTQSYVGELSYAFNYQDSTIVRPYFALRYTNIKQDAYTETGVDNPLSYAKLGDRSTTALMGVKLNHALTPRTNLTASLGLEQDLHHRTDQLKASAADISGLTSENFNNNIKRTRPVASAGAYYAVAKNQRLSGEVYYQQLPFQSTGSATAYFNYMIGF